MRIWNGWGDDTVRMDLPPHAKDLLNDLVGEGTPRRDFPLERILSRIPSSRIPDHRLVSKDPRQRLVHSHGQGLPDWIALRYGTLNRFLDGVAFPDTAEEVHSLLGLARDQDLIVIPYGGGTSVVGHLDMPQDDRPVLSISLERLNRMVSIDPYNMLATFEAGIRGPGLEADLRDHRFTLGHYPQSFEYSTLGGWIVTRSSGQQSPHYGRIENLFAGGEILTPRGILNCPPFPASAAGPDLRQLVLGSEGRLGIVVKAIVRISRLPERDDVWSVFFPSWECAIEAVRSLATSDIPYSMIRLSNPTETRTNFTLAGRERGVNLLKQYLRFRNIRGLKGCMCLVGFIGSSRQVAAARASAFSIFRRNRGVSLGKPIGRAWKKGRFTVPYLRNTLWDMGYGLDTLETAVTWDSVTATMQEIERAINEGLAPWDEKVHVFSHLSHVYPTGSSIYTTFLFRLAEDAEEMMDRWRAIKDSASRTIVRAGGTISHQHGVGLDHLPYLGAEKGRVGIGLLKDAFAHIDPEKRMNPGKLVPE